MTYTPEWEVNEQLNLTRLKIPGGWLVRIWDEGYKDGLVFVPGNAWPEWWSLPPLPEQPDHAPDTDRDHKH